MMINFAPTRGQGSRVEHSLAAWGVAQAGALRSVPAAHRGTV